MVNKEYSEAKLIFTTIAMLSTRHLLLAQHKIEAAKEGGKIAKDARLQLEQRTGQKVVTSENFLPSSKKPKQIKKKD